MLDQMLSRLPSAFKVSRAIPTLSDVLMEKHSIGDTFNELVICRRFNVFHFFRSTYLFLYIFLKSSSLNFFVIKTNNAEVLSLGCRIDCR